MTLASLRTAFTLSDRELALIEAFDARFVETATHTNLVSRSTLDDRWQRHYADSLQLWPLVPAGAENLLDIGAGGGFPGIFLAILATVRRPALQLTLVDSVGKKAGFLADICDILELTNITVKAQRAEQLPERFDVITARAVAALPKLLALCQPRLEPGGTLILPKGSRAGEEVDAANRDWRMTLKRVDSETDPDATILVITELERRR